MKTIILSLISLTLISCGEKKNTDNWKAPNIYYLRAEGNKNTVLSNKDTLQLNDYIYFSSADQKEPSPEDMKNDSTLFTITTDTTCVSDGKSFKSRNIYVKNNFKIKEIVPIEALLYPPENISCKMAVQLLNSSGSTKTYLIHERTIDLNNFKYDFELKAQVTQAALSSQYVLDLKSNELLSLVCDSFVTQEKNSGQPSVSLEKLVSSLTTLVGDIPLTQYRPSPYCRVTINDGARKLVSNKFSILFDKLMPKYSYKVYGREHRIGGRLLLYDLIISNPSGTPISVALWKPSLSIPLYSVTSGGGSKNGGDRPDRTHSYNENAAYEVSGDASTFDKGSAVVIHILPGKTFSLRAYANGSCKHNHCVYSNVSHLNLPIYNLEYNYRSAEEIEKATNVNILNVLLEN